MAAKGSDCDRVEGIIRAPRQHQYENVPLPLIRDNRLSYRALGVLTRLLSNENSYRMTSADLARERKEGRDAVRASLREIEKAGYIVRERRQNSRGQWVTDMVVYEWPRPTKDPPQSGGSQSSASQSSVTQSSENQALKTALPIRNTTTTTTEVTDHAVLYWSSLPQIAEEQRVVVLGLMEGLTATQQQDLLDELAGALRTGVIKGAWPAWLHRLIERAREGLFQPSLALSIRSERQRCLNEMSLAKVREEEAKIRAARRSDPVAVARSQALAAAAFEELKSIRGHST
jgi:hypothetical protein